MNAPTSLPDSASTSAIPSPLDLRPTLLISSLRTVVPDGGCTMDALIRVQAPTQPAGNLLAPRQPLRLSVVVDRSGSMSGEPLNEALRCVNHIASRLQPTDQIAVVLYDSHVQLPVPLQPANATTVQRALAGVESGGNTALFDGWQAGVDQLLGITAGQLGLEVPTHVPSGSLSRVILLSDGQANNGLTEPLEIAKHCAKALTQGVSTTTVGLGRGFNEDLMIGMARAGGGLQYYGQTAEDLYDNFDEELALLQSLYLRQLHLKLTPADGVIAEPLGVVEVLHNGQYRLSDLAWGAESWLLVRLHVGHATVGTQKALLAATLTAQVQQTSQVETGVVQPSIWHFPMLTLPVVVDADWHGAAKDETVANRVLEVAFGEQAALARGLLMRGRVADAERLFAALEPQVAHHPWLQNKLSSLRELARRDADMAAKELRFSHMKMSKRAVALNEASVQFCVGETDSTEIPAFLRRKMSEGKGRKTPTPDPK